MGVKDLWEILDKVKESKKLDLLSSKRIAIDLSGWVVQAETRKGLNLSKYPYLKLLYFRVRHLLLHGIHPVFILEGKMPEIKEKEFRRRNNLENNGSEKSTRSKLDNSLKQCQKLLTSLGIPCLKAAGEAEAYCAYLCLHEKVDAVMTEDSDAILYGADPVYRGFKIENEDVIEYSLKSKKNKLKIDRKKCVAMALLLGCDYGDKISTIGVSTVSKFLLEAKDVDILHRFQDWKKLDEAQLFPGYNSKQEKLSHCTYCGHVGKKSIHVKEGCRFCASNVCFPNSETPCSCAWHKNNEIFTSHKSEMKIYQAVNNIEDFPNHKLIDEYLNYTDEIPDDDLLEWKCPIIKDFKERTSEFMAPTFDWLKEILPLISAWQFQKLEKVIPINSSEFLLQPLKIKKRKTIQKVKYFVVEWNLKDEENNVVVETEEQESIFQKAYLKTVEEFYFSEEKSKQKKRIKPAVGNRKVINDSTISTPPFSNNVIQPERLNNLTDVNTNVSTNQSYGSFSDLPLVERIRVLSLKNVTDQKASKTISSLNSNGTESKQKLETKSSASSNIISLVFDSSGFSELSDLDNPRLNKNKENSAPLTPFEVNKNLCLVFSDSDDSFLSNCKQEEKLCDKSSFLSRKSVVLSNASNDSFVINEDLYFKKNYAGEMLCVERNVFKSPESSSSPRPIYSVCRTSKQNSSILCIDNSPINFSTPKSRHPKSNPKESLYPQAFNVFKQKTMGLVFSPVFFDSSDDSILAERYSF